MFAHANSLRSGVAQLRLPGVRIRDDGTLVIQSDEHGYKTAKRFSARASQVLGAYVQLITDGVPGAAAPRSCDLKGRSGQIRDLGPSKSASSDGNLVLRLADGLWISGVTAQRSTDG